MSTAIPKKEQYNGSDCGVYAFAKSLCLGHKPYNMTFIYPSLGLSENILNAFEAKRSTLEANKTTQNFQNTRNPIEFFN